MISNTLRFLSKLLKVLMPFLSAFVGIKLFYTYNIFEKLISDPDIANDVGISVYFASSEIVLNCIANFFETRIKKQRIEVVFYRGKENPSIMNTPTLSINGTTPERIRVDISVSAYQSKCKDLRIISSASPFYTMQLSNPSNVAGIDSNGNFVVYIDKMFNAQAAINTKISLDIMFIKNQDVQVKSDLCCELNKNKLFTEFTSNKAIIEIR